MYHIRRIIIIITLGSVNFMTDNLRRSHRTSITDTETYFHLENKRLITRNIIISVWALEETLQTDQQRNFNFLHPRSKRFSQTLSRTLQRRNPPSWYSVKQCMRVAMHTICYLKRIFWKMCKSINVQYCLV